MPSLLYPPDFRVTTTMHFTVTSAGLRLSNAALYEGSSAAGGYAVPIEVAGYVVPLAPQDAALRRIATVIATKSDLKVSQAITRGAFAAKTETSAFSTAQPSLSQFTISAFAVGVETPMSIELAQDAEYFKTFGAGPYGHRSSGV